MEVPFMFPIIHSPCFLLTYLCQRLRDLAWTLLAFVSQADLLSFICVVWAAKLNNVQWTLLGFMLGMIFKTHWMFSPSCLVSPQADELVRLKNIVVPNIAPLHGGFMGCHGCKQSFFGWWRFSYIRGVIYLSLFLDSSLREAAWAIWRALTQKPKIQLAGLTGPRLFTLLNKGRAVDRFSHVPL